MRAPDMRICKVENGKTYKCIDEERHNLGCVGCLVEAGLVEPPEAILGFELVIAYSDKSRGTIHEDLVLSQNQEVSAIFNQFRDKRFTKFRPDLGFMKYEDCYQLCWSDPDDENDYVKMTIAEKGTIRCGEQY